MPAASDPPARESGSPRPGPTPTPSLPHTWRPLGPRIMGIVLFFALVAVCAFAWFGFDDATRAKFTVFQEGTLVFFGLLAAACMHALVRSRVVARRAGLVVVNGYRRRELDWAQIIRVNLPPGAPWATLDLSDGSTVSVMGIQSSDGDRARTAVRQLRVLATELPR